MPDESPAPGFPCPLVLTAVLPCWGSPVRHHRDTSALPTETRHSTRMRRATQRASVIRCVAENASAALSARPPESACWPMEDRLLLDLRLNTFLHRHLFLACASLAFCLWLPSYSSQRLPYIVIRCPRQPSPKSFSLLVKRRRRPLTTTAPADRPAGACCRRGSSMYEGLQPANKPGRRVPVLAADCRRPTRVHPWPHARPSLPADEVYGY